MKTENSKGRPHWDTWAKVSARTVFLGLDFGQRPNQQRDCLAVLRFSKTQWEVAIVHGPDWVRSLHDWMIEPAVRYAVLTMDGCLTKPVVPEYWQRGCEGALNVHREVNINWQGQSFQKVRDLVEQLPLQGPATRILLETHPQSNYPARIRDSATECDLFVRNAFRNLTGSEVPANFPAASQPHAQHAIAAALVSVAYGRFRSRGVLKDYLATVIDHDGCFWLLDFASLPQQRARGGRR